MEETYISFYLRAGRIHVFIDSLRAINCPRRICFMIDNDGKNLLMIPYSKIDFISHKVPDKVYQGRGCLEISSLNLCKLIANMKNWNKNNSYRVPGKINSKINAVVFRFDKAVII